MPPSIERIATILALWRIGAAYLPLDMKLPRDRVARILNKARPTFALSLTAFGPDHQLLSNAANSEETLYEPTVYSLIKLVAEAGVPTVDERVSFSALMQMVHPSAPNASGVSQSSSLALVMFTSGSTGEVIYSYH